MKIKFTQEATIYLNGYTPTIMAAGDVADIEDGLARGIISEGKAVEADAAPSAPAAGAGAEGTAPNYAKMTKTQLAEYAAELEVKLDASKTKDEMIAELEAALAAKSNS